MARIQLAVFVMAAVAILIIAFVVMAPQTMEAALGAEMVVEGVEGNIRLAWGAMQVIKKAGYPGIFATVLLFVCVLAAALKKSRMTRSLFRRHWLGLLVVLFCAGLLHVHEPHRFRTLYDEHVLLATSLNMHVEREAAMPIHAHFIHGRFMIQGSVVDKRPLLFPFLLSLVHDVAGYRVENAFILNGVLTLLVLLLLYAVGARFGGGRYGVLGVLLFTAVPLVAMNATSGGAELLNTCLVLGLILAAIRYLESPGEQGLSLMVLTGILLAQVRYESILYLLVPAAAAAAKWRSERRIAMTWITALSPVLLLPPLLSLQVFRTSGEAFQLGTLGRAAFGMDNVVPNLGHAAFFLFDLENDLPNSFLVSVIGMISAIAALLWIARRGRSMVAYPGKALICTAAALVTAANMTILLFYYWGQLDDPMVMRLALPLHAVLAIGACAAVREAWKDRPLPVAAPVAVFLVMLLFSVPCSARSATTRRIDLAADMDWFVDYLRTETTRDTLVLAESALPMIVSERPAIPAYQVNETKAKLKQFMASGLCRDILVFQRFSIDPATGRETDLGKHRLDPAFKLQPVTEWRSRPDIVARVSRVVAIEGPADGPTAASPQTFSSKPEQMRHLLELYP